LLAFDLGIDRSLPSAAVATARGVGAQLLENGNDDPVLLPRQSEEQVERPDLGVPVSAGELLRGLAALPGP
jgi:hypothetical protein